MDIQLESAMPREPVENRSLLCENVVWPVWAMKLVIYKVAVCSRCNPGKEEVSS